MYSRRTRLAWLLIEAPTLERRDWDMKDTSSKFNDSYIGLPKRAVNLVGAEDSVSYYLKPYLYFRPHFEFNSIANVKLRQYLDSSTIKSFGLAMGAEF